MSQRITIPLSLPEKFTNCIMYDGKKSVARGVWSDAMNLIREAGESSPTEVVEKAVANCSPAMEVRSKRVGGAVYQVPFPVREKRQLSLSIRFLRDAARGKKGVPMGKALAEEFLLAAKGEGAAIRKHDEVIRMADASKMFAHFANY